MLSLSNIKDLYFGALTKESFIESGISSLDKAIGGLCGLVGLVGAPKSNKSTLVLQLAVNLLYKDTIVIFIDCENGINLTITRFLCNIFDLSIKEFEELSQDKKEALYKQIENLPFYYFSGRPELEDIDMAIKSFPKDKKICVIVDSLQALPRSFSEERTIIDTWLAFLDELKIKYEPNFLAIIVSEKRRECYDTPSRDAGKGSGRIEYKVSQLIDISKDYNKVMLEVVLNRYGIEGAVVPLKLRMHNNSFTFRLEP